MGSIVVGHGNQGELAACWPDEAENRTFPGQEKSCSGHTPPVRSLLVRYVSRFKASQLRLLPYLSTDSVTHGGTAKDRRGGALERAPLRINEDAHPVAA